MQCEKPIFYFSGTGGCIAATNRISDEVAGYTPVPIAAFKEGYTVAGDACGFVFPLYYAGLPRIVAEFIPKIKFTKPCYIFAVVACGVPWSGYALHQLNWLLRRQKQKVTTGFYLRMVDNFLPHYDVPPHEKLEAIYRECNTRLEQIIVSIRAREHMADRDNAFYLYAMYPFFIRALQKYDKHFTTTSNCNGCGLCQKVCPVENISLVDGAPAWLHRCEFCQACISFCPQKAVQWKTVTQSKGRYHFEGITARQIAEQKNPAGLNG